MALEAQIFSLAQWALVAAGLWWIGGFALWWLALQRQSDGARDLAGRLALPGTRQLATALVAAGLIVSPACSTGHPTPQLTYVGEADQPTPTTQALPPTPLEPTTLPPTTLPPTTLPPTTLPDASSEPTAGELPPVEPSRPLVHEVVSGEHLWGIAASRLAAITDSNPSNTEIARYWRRLITTNAETIRSGDPNLIHPGERLALPSTDGP